MNKKVLDIIQHMVQEAINREALTKSPKTVRNIHGVLSAVLKHDRPKFALNTVLPQKTPPKIFIPSEANIKYVLDYVAGTEMELSILNGCIWPYEARRDLCLGQHHITGNVVHVMYFMALDEHHNWVKKVPKSISSDRHIEFPDFVIKKTKGISGPITNINPL